MGWNELAGNWSAYLRALARRFPHVDPRALSAVKDQPCEVGRILASSHDLTLNEAREVLDDFLFVQRLARDTADIRSHGRV